MQNEQNNTKYTKTAKLVKIEERAWKEVNINRRGIFTKVMIELRMKWENEVESITGNKNEMFGLWNGEEYTYTFGDILA